MPSSSSWLEVNSITAVLKRAAARLGIEPRIAVHISAALSQDGAAKDPLALNIDLASVMPAAEQIE
jgi:hypothetical protein